MRKGQPPKGNALFLRKGMGATYEVIQCDSREGDMRGKEYVRALAFPSITPDHLAVEVVDLRGYKHTKQKPVTVVQGKGHDESLDSCLKEWALEIAGDIAEEENLYLYDSRGKVIEQLRERKDDT